MSMNPNQISPRRMEGIRNYAMADKSDPFAYARAMTHTLNGIAGFTSQGEEAFYDAKPIEVERKTADGKSYKAIDYVNRVRP